MLPFLSRCRQIQENYKRRLLKGTLFFKSQPPQLLSKGKPLKYFYTISKYSHLISSLSISDNIFAIRRSSFPNLFYIPKYAKIAAEDLLKEFKLSISIHTPVSELTKAQQHLLLILKAYISSAKIIFLDDFVESYTYAEFQQFLTLIRQLRDREITFLVFSKVLLWSRKMQTESLLYPMTVSQTFFHMKTTMLTVYPP